MTSLEALLPLLRLDRLPRTGWLQAGIADPETVAAHSAGAALLALVLGPRVDPPLDVDRAVALCVVHDAPEALIGDFPRGASTLLPEGAKRAAEGAAAEHLLGPLGGEALARWREFDACETREARFADLCDRLQLGVRLVGYHRQGQRGLGRFAGSVADLDCAEFPPCGDLQREVLAAMEEPPPAL